MILATKLPGRSLRYRVNLEHTATAPELSPSLPGELSCEQDLPIITLILGDDAARAEVVLRGLPGGLRHRLQAFWLVQQIDRHRCHCVRVAYLKEEPVDAVVDQLRHAAYAGCD